MNTIIVLIVGASPDITLVQQAIERSTRLHDCILIGITEEPAPESQSIDLSIELVRDTESHTKMARTLEEMIRRPKSQAAGAKETFQPKNSGTRLHIPALLPKNRTSIPIWTSHGTFHKG